MSAFRLSRFFRLLLAAVACVSWLYTAFLAHRLFSFVGMQPTMENRGWIALALRSGWGGAVLTLSFAVFVFIMTARKNSGLLEASVWLLVMIGAGVQLRYVSPGFIGRQSASQERPSPGLPHAPIPAQASGSVPRFSRSPQRIECPQSRHAKRTRHSCILRAQTSSR